MQISPTPRYTLTLDEKEYTLLTRALAVMAGLNGVTVKPEDGPAAIDLSRKMLLQQRAHYIDRLNIIDAKLSKTQPDDVPDNADSSRNLRRVTDANS